MPDKKNMTVVGVRFEDPDMERIRVAARRERIPATLFIRREALRGTGADPDEQEGGQA